MRTRIIAASIASAALVATFPSAVMAAPGGNQGNGQQHRNSAVRKRSGDCVRGTAGTLDTTDVATLQAMAEEEKLAHDVYVALDKSYHAPVFARIATSESRHLAAVRTLMARYGVTDPTAGLDEGVFPTSSTAQLYQDLLAQATTLQRALEVGATIERQDIADLRDAIAQADQRDVTRVYTHLLRGSQRHLTAFTR